VKWTALLKAGMGGIQGEKEDVPDPFLWGQTGSVVAKKETLTAKRGATGFVTTGSGESEGRLQKSQKKDLWKEKKKRGRKVNKRKQKRRIPDLYSLIWNTQKGKRRGGNNQPPPDNKKRSSHSITSRRTT